MARKGLDEMAEMSVVVVRATAKAVCVRIPDLDDEQHWIPRSCVDWDASEAEPEEGSSGTLMVHERFARKEGLL